eukprot:TRINITY_DN2712_c0_g2_i1.p1 TRINITY_DN2712_c0_g2~~TRINITY_DN2712_c0_g2_i1.p1  ORF type:complete len:224 (-),score=72.19 TRINITY_DN2712_c0_g2_i1:249-920(-)
MFSDSDESEFDIPSNTHPLIPNTNNFTHQMPKFSDSSDDEEFNTILKNAQRSIQHEKAGTNTNTNNSRFMTQQPPTFNNKNNNSRINNNNNNNNEGNHQQLHRSVSVNPNLSNGIRRNIPQQQEQRQRPHSVQSNNNNTRIQNGNNNSDNNTSGKSTRPPLSAAAFMGGVRSPLVNINRNPDSRKRKRPVDIANISSKDITREFFFYIIDDRNVFLIFLMGKL